MKFKNRRAAGTLLANRLTKFRDATDMLVLGLPRGGVPVAAEIAQALHAELDILVVRKLGLPWQPELAAGALASGGAKVLNQSVIQTGGLSDQGLQSIVAAEQEELRRRERLYRGDRPALVVRDRRVIVADDGSATGATMRAALKALRSLQPRQLIAAIPVAAADALRHIATEADEVVCLQTPQDFTSVGQWYQDFNPVEDDEVRQLLLNHPAN